MADSVKPPGPPDTSAPVQGPVYGFTEQGHARVSRATKLVEKELVPAATGRRGRYPIGGAGGGQVAVVKTTVGARSGSTYGTGTVTFKVDGGTAYEDGADDVPVKNPYATAIAVGKWVTLVRASGGWTIFGADCP